MSISIFYYSHCQPTSLLFQSKQCVTVQSDTDDKGKYKAGYGTYNCEEGKVVARMWDDDSATCDERTEHKRVSGSPSDICFVVGKASIFYDCSSGHVWNVSYLAVLSAILAAVAGIGL